MEVCSHNLCTGCYSCVSACPHKCIKMQEDKYGELHPVIEEEKCVQCGICIKSCPNNVRIEYQYPLKCYASWITNERKRKKCASGGIGSIISEYAIKYEKCVVFGSRYDDKFTPIMAYAESISEIDDFKGSRYVQTIVRDTYLQVKSFLKEERKVVFIGVPCQIAGLKCFLKKDYDNLITVDLICHGCSPTSYFKAELSYICKKNNISEVSEVRFRGNDRYNFCFSLWGGKNRSKCLYCKRGYASYYLGGFLLGVTLRENCYNCKYARPERISDITIGDFIGLGEDPPFDYPTYNVSSVMINTMKGDQFYMSVSKKMTELINIERHYSERLKYKPSLVEPYKRHPLSDSFRKAYLDGGYIYASRKVLADIVCKADAKNRRDRLKRFCYVPFYIIRRLFLHN